MSLDDLQSALGLRFRNVSLLEQALTHRSYLNEHPDADLGGLAGGSRMESGHGWRSPS